MSTELLQRLLIMAGLLAMSVSVYAGSAALQRGFSLDRVPEIRVDELDVATLEQRYPSPTDKRQPFVYAEAVELSISFAESAEWKQVATGQWVGRLVLRSPGATSIDFGFERFQLPAGGRVVVYDPQAELVRGPFTKADATGGRWIPLVKGDTVVVEATVSDIEQTELVIGKVHRGFREFWKANVATKSGPCNIDVVCPEGAPWREEIRSVARYTFNRGTQGIVCTGSLVNNTGAHLRPYFLTANHCVSTVAEAASLTTFWNYETSQCAGVPDGSLAQSQSGSIIRATSATMDFTLLELDQVPAAAFAVHYAGWDHSATAPNSGATIHHPTGDEKRISFENDPLIITEFGENVEDNTQHYLRVFNWDLGTTEAGSSGAGLWNANHHIVGTLSGGSASCSAPLPDWYGRFATAWTGDGNTATSLAAWLDPTNSGVVSLDGVDAGAKNQIPNAIAFSTGSVVENSTATLDGTASHDVDGGVITFQWTQTTGPTVTLSDPTAAAATFTAPEVSGNTTLGFRLIVTDAAGAVDEDTTFVTVTNPAGIGGGGGGATGWLLVLLCVCMTRRRHSHS